MPSELERRALDQIAQETEPAKLLQRARNARGKSDIVEREALRRLSEESPMHDPRTVQHAIWGTIHTVEAIRQLEGRKAWRMNRTRRKIGRDGEVAFLEYCALQETAGFGEIMEYGMPELCAEAIVLRFKNLFSAVAVDAAGRRLREQGFEISREGQVIASA